MPRCNHCEKVFSRGDNLKRHLIHIHKEETLTKHVKIATRIAPYDMQSKENWRKNMKIVPYDDYMKFLESQKKAIGVYQELKSIGERLRIFIDDIEGKIKKGRNMYMKLCFKKN